MGPFFKSMRRPTPAANYDKRLVTVLFLTTKYIPVGSAPGPRHTVHCLENALSIKQPSYTNLSYLI